MTLRRNPIRVFAALRARRGGQVTARTASSRQSRRYGPYPLQPHYRLPLDAQAPMLTGPPPNWISALAPVTYARCGAMTSLSQRRGAGHVRRNREVPMQTMNAEAHTPARTATARGGNRRRRGISSVLAMMYLMIFSTLALGFYATTTTASQVSHNERTTLAAHMAAESGTHFLRYHLSALDVRANLTPERMFEEVYMQLASRLDGTGNLDGSAVGYDGTTITIPQVGYIALDREGNQRFRASLSRAGDLLVARVVGRGSNRSPGSTFVPTSSDGTGRGIEIKFQKANNATAIFNYGVASKGTVYTSGTSTITGLTDPMKGSILSTNMTAEVPVSIMGRKV